MPLCPRKEALTGGKSSFDRGAGALNWRYRRLVQSKSRENRLAGRREAACRRNSGDGPGLPRTCHSFFQPPFRGTQESSADRASAAAAAAAAAAADHDSTLFPGKREDSFFRHGRSSRGVARRLTRAKLSTAKTARHEIPSNRGGSFVGRCDVV